MIVVRTEPAERGDFFRQTAEGEEVTLWWLGQAGFALRYRHSCALLDPYLSDHLAKKYQARKFPHVRMMPSPLDPGQVRGLNLVLCSHRHGDHMDPEALPVMAANNPACRFVVPRAEVQFALEIGLPESQLTGLDAGESLFVGEEIEVAAVPAAHETLDVDDNGHHQYIGFILRLGRVTLYHSGDCVPYDGLAERLQRARIDVGMLPVNGRDDFRRSHGIVGNFEWEEALALCREAEIPVLIPHHFGMFAFNTADPMGWRSILGHDARFPRVVVPELDRKYVVVATDCRFQRASECCDSTILAERRTDQWHEM